MKPDPNKPVIEISPDAAVPFSEDTVAMHDEYGKTLKMIGDVVHYNYGDSPASFSEWEDSLAGGGYPVLGNFGIRRSRRSSRPIIYGNPRMYKKSHTITLSMIKRLTCYLPRGQNFIKQLGL